MNAYDFDNTLYDGESALDFFLFCLRRHPDLIKFFPRVIIGAIRYKREKVSIDEFLNEFGKLLEEYFSNCSGDFESLCIEFWDKNMHKIKPFYELQQKDDDVVISASPEFMIKEVCLRLGIRNYISTGFDIKTGQITLPCFRETKVDRFLERYPEGKIDEFYTDSMNDKFLMPYAEKVFLVTGNRIEQVK